MTTDEYDVLVVGGGPAGLRAAELVSAAGLRTLLADRMRSVGRKFLVAGRGGLNLTHSEPIEEFCPRYGEPQQRWRDLLAAFSPDDLRSWAKDLGVETFIGTSRRVFPMGKQAAPLLRRWMTRLRQQAVAFRLRHSLNGFRKIENGRWEVAFEHDGTRVAIRARAVILALGGASWPQTGSDARWSELMASIGIPVTPLAPANCGYEVDWPPELLASAEGMPIKNVVVRADGHSINGELLITSYGLEGGALYQLGPVLRAMEHPQLTIDLKPTFTEAQLAAKVGRDFSTEQVIKSWRLGPAAAALLRLHAPFSSATRMAEAAKALGVHLRGPRPLAEAISTAGGVKWDCLDDNLMLLNQPGVFCAGEMIDWEAPTGGYLLQGCFSTGMKAARGAIRFLSAA